MKNIILYGSGNVGVASYEFLESKNLGEACYAFCATNPKYSEKMGKRVISYDVAKTLNYPIVICLGSNNSAYPEIEQKLINDGVEYYNNISEYLHKAFNWDRTSIYRDFCGFFHIKGMNDYFESAENDRSLSTFWSESSPFYSLFVKLNLTNVIELSCGRGRHVQKYIDNAGNITLVDVLQENIDYVKNRFSGIDKIHYYKNNGHDLSELPNNTYTSLFTYDAMVHFEFMDIFNYLCETHRVLTPGGYALFHHSNDSSDYKSSYFLSRSNHSGRNFMDKKLFAFLAYRAGLEIIEQRVIAWGNVPDLDCISLVQKQSI